MTRDEFNAFTHASILAARREAAMKNAPACPYCEAVQVQLMPFDLEEWKCRMCKRRFARVEKAE
jgi:ribosomal protein L37AE/L43A